MSDRTRSVQPTQDLTEAQSSLESLAASKDLHKRSGINQETQPANQTDLSGASISTANVHRVTPRVEPRQDVSQARTTRPSHIIQTGRAKASADRAAGSDVGIFKNPAFKYSGDLLSKILTFFANILKVLERLFLRLLAGPDRKAPKPITQTATNQPQPKRSNNHDTQRRERDAKERAQTVRRG